MKRKSLTQIRKEAKLRKDAINIRADDQELKDMDSPVSEANDICCNTNSSGEYADNNENELSDFDNDGMDSLDNNFEDGNQDNNDFEHDELTESSRPKDDNNDGDDSSDDGCSNFEYDNNFEDDDEQSRDFDNDDIRLGKVKCNSCSPGNEDNNDFEHDELADSSRPKDDNNDGDDSSDDGGGDNTYDDCDNVMDNVEMAMLSRPKDDNNDGDDSSDDGGGDNTYDDCDNVMDNVEMAMLTNTSDIDVDKNLVIRLLAVLKPLKTFLSTRLGGGYSQTKQSNCALRLSNMLVWTALNSSQNKILDESTLLPWMEEILRSEYTLIDSYCQYLEETKLYSASTIRNYLYDYG
jgi:hypothetical protein